MGAYWRSGTLFLCCAACVSADEKSLQRAEALNALGKTYFERSCFQDAWNTFEQALAEARNVPGPNPQIAVALENLGVIASVLSPNDEAQVSLAHPHGCREQIQNGESDGPRPTVPNHPTDAETLLRSALEIHLETAGPRSSEVARTKSNLAALYVSKGLYSKAETLYKETLALREQLFGPDDPAVALALNNLGQLYRTQNKIAKAEECHRRALEIREKALPADSSEIANTMINLGAICELRGRLDEAERLFRRALAIEQNTLGAASPEAALVWNNLAVVMQRRNHAREAEQMYRQALEIWGAALAPEHPRIAGVCQNLALTLESAKRYPEADSYFKKAIAIWSRHAGSHAQLATALSNHANLLKKMGRKKDASAEMAQAKTILREHPETRISTWTVDAADLNGATSFRRP